MPSTSPAKAKASHAKAKAKAKPEPAVYLPLAVAPVANSLDLSLPLPPNVDRLIEASRQGSSTQSSPTSDAPPTGHGPAREVKEIKEEPTKPAPPKAKPSAPKKKTGTNNASSQGQGTKKKAAAKQKLASRPGSADVLSDKQQVKRAKQAQKQQQPQQGPPQAPPQPDEPSNEEEDEWGAARRFHAYLSPRKHMRSRSPPSDGLERIRQAQQQMQGTGFLSSRRKAHTAMLLGFGGFRPLKPTEGLGRIDVAAARQQQMLSDVSGLVATRATVAV